MKKTKRTLGLGLLSLLFGLLSAHAAERNVVGEYFTQPG